MTIKVYTKDNCVQCKMSKKKLDELNISYEEIYTGDNPDIINEIKEKYKISSLPLIVTDKEFWVGYRPEKIKNLA